MKTYAAQSLLNMNTGLKPILCTCSAALTPLDIWTADTLTPNTVEMQNHTVWCGLYGCHLLSDDIDFHTLDPGLKRVRLPSRIGILQQQNQDILRMGERIYHDMETEGERRRNIFV